MIDRSSCFFDKQTIIKKRRASFLCLTISLSRRSLWLRPQFNCLLFPSTITTFDKNVPANVWVCVWVLDVCLQKKTEIEFALFKQNASSWTVFVLLFFWLFYPFLLLFLVARFEFAPQVQDSGLKKVSSGSFQTKLEILPNFDIFNHCPRARASTCGRTLVKRFLFFTFFDFLQYFNTFLLGFLVFLLLHCCKLRSLSYTPSLSLLLPSPSSCPSCFV